MVGRRKLTGSGVNLELDFGLVETGEGQAPHPNIGAIRNLIWLGDPLRVGPGSKQSVVHLTDQQCDRSRRPLPLPEHAQTADKIVALIWR